MAKKVYGYARVSSKDQNEERQLIALKQFPVPESLNFVNKQSGKDFNRHNTNCYSGSCAKEMYLLSSR